MSETTYKVMMYIPGLGPDLQIGLFYSKGSALELARKIAAGELGLYIEAETVTTEIDEFYGTTKGDPA